MSLLPAFCKGPMFAKNENENVFQTIFGHLSGCSVCCTYWMLLVCVVLRSYHCSNFVSKLVMSNLRPDWQRQYRGTMFTWFEMSHLNLISNNKIGGNRLLIDTSSRLPFQYCSNSFLIFLFLFLRTRILSTIFHSIIFMELMLHSVRLEWYLSTWFLFSQLRIF